MGLRHYFLPFLTAQLMLVSVHIGLATTGKINVWEFGGYGMYAIPPPRVRIMETAIQPAITAGMPMPELNWTRLMRSQLRAGGCWFGFSERITDAVVADLHTHSLRLTRATFGQRQFNTDKTALIWKPMAELHAEVNMDGHIQVTRTVCGETQTVTRRGPAV